MTNIKEKYKVSSEMYHLSISSALYPLVRAHLAIIDFQLFLLAFIFYYSYIFYYWYIYNY